MPFRLTNAGEYAVRLMVYLAGRDRNELISAREIAENQQIPHRFLRSIISQFAKQGFVTSVQGSGGGVRLAEGAEQRSLLDVIEAVEGPIYLNVCMQGDDICQFSNHCSVHLVWHEAQESIKAILGKKTISELSGHNLVKGSLLPSAEQMCGVPALDRTPGAADGN